MQFLWMFTISLLSVLGEAPTSYPTPYPSVHVGSVMLQFESMFDYVNVTSTEMNTDFEAQQAALIATATGLGHGVTVPQLVYLNAVAQARNLSGALSGLVEDTSPSARSNVTIQITVPVAQLGTSSGAQAWTQLTNALAVSVASGAYDAALHSASVSTGTTATMYVTVPDVDSAFGIQFATTGTPTNTPSAYPTVPAPEDMEFIEQYSLELFYGCIAATLFLVGMFTYWLQLTFHAGVLNVSSNGGVLAYVICDYAIMVSSLFSFFYYLTLYGGLREHASGTELFGGLTPFVLLLCSRVISVFVCGYILRQLFSADNVDVGVGKSIENISNIPLSSLLYRAALGYFYMTPGNAATTDQDPGKQLGDSAIFSLVFPAYSLLLMFCSLELRVFRLLPWVKTA